MNQTGHRFFARAALVAAAFSLPLIASAQPNPDVSDVGVDKTAWSTATYSGTTGITYYVSPTGNDANAGTSRATAVRTVQKAIDYGKPQYVAGKHVKILIAPGTYQETFNLNYAVNYTPPPTVPDGDDTTPPGSTTVILDRDGSTGEVTMIGSTEFPGGWTLSGEPGVYYQPWNNNWGDGESPWSRPDVKTAIESTPLKRREGVFVAGDELRQILKEGTTTYHDLQDKQFLVDEVANKIYIRDDSVTFTGSGSSRVANKKIEITTLVQDPLDLSKGNGCVIANVDNVKISNITFKQFPTIWLGGGLLVQRARNVWIKGCTFTQNSAVGLTVINSNWIQLEGVNASDNGSLGMSGTSAHRILMARIVGTPDIINSFNTNNYRGKWGNYCEWYIAGCKLGTCNKTKLDTVYFDSNNGHGLWFDVGSRNNYVYNCTMLDNYLPGGKEHNALFYEISYGPAKFESCTMAGSDYGAFISNSLNAYLFKSTIYDCLKGEVCIRNDATRQAPTGDYCTNFWMKQNNISYSFSNPNHLLVRGKGQTANYNACLAEATIANNKYTAKATNVNMFSKTTDANDAPVPISFSEWQNASNPARDTSASGSTIQYN